MYQDMWVAAGQEQGCGITQKDNYSCSNIHFLHHSTTCRDTAEFGRNISFPSNWHGYERRDAMVWYHCLPKLKLQEFAAGDTIYKAGDTGTTACWLLSGTPKASDGRVYNTFEMMGEESLQGQPYSKTITAETKAGGSITCSCITVRPH